MMIEKTILDYLNKRLDVLVALEKSDKPLEKFVILEKTGSSESNHIYSATVAIQSYASSLYEAATLNESVKDAMKELATLDSVARCALNSDYNFSDTTTKEYRYQAVFDIKHY